jgi:hypothetical protein
VVVVDDSEDDLAFERKDAEPIPLEQVIPESKPTEPLL